MLIKELPIKKEKARGKPTDFKNAPPPPLGKNKEATSLLMTDGFLMNYSPRYFILNYCSDLAVL